VIEMQRTEKKLAVPLTGPESARFAVLIEPIADDLSS
jgi:hypothetical protein